jgi:hypothetical protein
VPVPAPLPPAAPGASGSTGSGGSSGGAAGGASTGGGGSTGSGGNATDLPAVGKGPFVQGVPSFELFDRTATSWVAFSELVMGQAAVIDGASRFVDTAGTVLVRFTYADPQQSGQQAYFDFEVSMEGVVE